MMGNKFNSFLRPTSVLLLAGVLTFAVTSLLFSTPTAAESTRMHGGVGGEWFTRQESSPKLVEILHGSGVHITQPSLARSSQCSSLVAGLPGAWASADTP